jgi:chromosome segregation ATPase
MAEPIDLTPQFVSDFRKLQAESDSLRAEVARLQTALEWAQAEPDARIERLNREVHNLKLKLELSAGEIAQLIERRDELAQSLSRTEAELQDARAKNDELAFENFWLREKMEEDSPP